LCPSSSLPTILPPLVFFPARASSFPILSPLYRFSSAPTRRAFPFGISHNHTTPSVSSRITSVGLVLGSGIEVPHSRISFPRFGRSCSCICPSPSEYHAMLPPSYFPLSPSYFLPSAFSSDGYAVNFTTSFPASQRPPVP
jgi:hypothetical protein